MIGAIVLTHRDRSTSRHQDITRQQQRRVADTLEIVGVRSGAGVAELGIYRPKPDRIDVPAAIGHDDAHAHDGAPAPEPVQGEH